MGPSRHAFSIANDKITKNRRKMFVFSAFLNQEVPCWSWGWGLANCQAFVMSAPCCCFNLRQSYTIRTRSDNAASGLMLRWVACLYRRVHRGGSALIYSEHSQSLKRGNICLVVELHNSLTILQQKWMCLCVWMCMRAVLQYGINIISQ